MGGDRERRDFLSSGFCAVGVVGAAGAAAGLAGLIPAFVGAEDLPTVNWRVTSSFPKSLDTIYRGAEQFARIIEAMTAGKFKISVAGR